MTNPKISVLMTVYNGETFLSDAIKSVLSQTFEDFEFLIIDDASTDKSQEIIFTFNDKRIKYKKNERNIGQTSSLNYGLELSKGEYIARMDQDDLSKPDRLRRQLNFLEDNRDTAVVGSWAESIDSNGNYLYTIIHPTKFKEIREAIACGCPISHSSAFFRRTEVIKSGGYPEDIVYAMDWNLWIRLIKNRYKLANLPLELVSIRTHNNSATSSQKLQFSRINEYLRFLKDAQDIPEDSYTKRLAKGIKFHYTLRKALCLLGAKKVRESLATIKELFTINPTHWLLLVVKKLIFILTKNSKHYYLQIAPIQKIVLHK